MTDSFSASESGPAPSINTVPPPLVLPGAGASRVIIEAIQPTIKDIRDEIKAAENKTDSHFKWLLVAFASGFLALGGMFIAGFLVLDAKIDSQTLEINSAVDSDYKDLDNKIGTAQDTLVQVTTQLSDLLQRIPPVVQPIPGK